MKKIYDAGIIFPHWYGNAEYGSSFFPTFHISAVAVKTTLAREFGLTDTHELEKRAAFFKIDAKNLKL